MSEWYSAEDDDIEIDGDEINIYVKSNDRGNVYVTVTIAQMKHIIDKQNELEGLG